MNPGQPGTAWPGAGPRLDMTVDSARMSRHFVRQRGWLLATEELVLNG
jgi:hypothetical protein